MNKTKKFFSSNKAMSKIAIAAIIILVAIVAGIIWSTQKSSEQMGPQEASAKAEVFINTYLMPSGSEAKILETSEEYDLYKMKIDIGSEAPVESYVTKDGSLFFPQALEIDQVNINDNNSASNNNTPAPVNIPKSDKPKVELFVMSYCPFGTQAEKGILPVLDVLGDKIDFTLLFNDYAMHDMKEIDENLVQYCIQKEQPEKLISYLSCFLEAGSQTDCLAANANEKNVKACVAATDKEFKVTENYNNKVDWRGQFPGFNVQKEANDKYDVGGSPTLVINETTVSSGRDSASLLKTICSAFNEAPEECNSQLNNQTPSSGFGFNFSAASAASADASCL
jgi:hypothetical protein